MPKASDIPDADILREIARIEKTERRWAFTDDLEKALPFPPKVILAKCKSLIKRKLITGCTCGCRGDFEITTPKS